MTYRTNGNGSRVGAGWRLGYGVVLALAFVMGVGPVPARRALALSFNVDIGSKPILKSCTLTVPSGTTRALTADLTKCGQIFPAVVVESGATLDLNGKKVACNAWSSSVGIVLRGAGARVINGTVAGCETAVLVQGTGGHEVSRVQISLANTAFNVQAPNNRFLDNTLFDVQLGWRGWDTHPLAGNTIERNTVHGRQPAGIGVYANVQIPNSSGNRIHDNVFTQISSCIVLGGSGNSIQGNKCDGMQVELSVHGSRNTIASNRLTSTTNEGHLIVWGTGNWVLTNQLRKTTLHASHPGSGEWNNIGGNGVSLARVGIQAHHANVYQNSVAACSEVGIRVDTRANVTGNSAFWNRVDAASACQYTTWSGNSFGTKNGACIR